MPSSVRDRRPLRQPAPGQRALALIPIALLLLLTLPAAAGAQVLYGSLVGNVSDDTGAAVPGATVTIRNKETGTSRDTTTDATGAYRFDTVQPGMYSVTVQLTGFRTLTRPDIPVTLNTTARADAKLQVGQLTESVTVSGETALLQTDRAEMRSELKADDLVNLPVSINRNYQYLFRTLPGFTPPAEAHSVPSNPSRALVFNVNGASRSSNNIRIDGVSTTNIWLPHVAAYVPALESLEAVNVVTNSFDAEQGLAGGSAINAQIKSGTNTLHGSAFEYHTNEGLRVAQLLRAAGHAERQLGIQPVRRNTRRPGRAQPLLLFRELRGDARPQGPERGRSRCRPKRCGAATSACRRCPSTIPSRATTPAPVAPRLRTTRYRRTASTRPRAGCSSLLPLPNLPNADGSMPETNNYFVAGAVHPQPAHAGHQGELERVREAELLRPLQRARLRHRERHEFRQGASGRSRSGAAILAGAKATPTTSRSGAPTRCRRRW